MKRVVLIGLVVLLMTALGGGAFLMMPNEQPTVQNSGSVTIKYWSVFERREDIQPLLDEFQNSNPGIVVEYEQRNVRNYRQQLENTAGLPEGPDVFRFHNSWTRTLKRQLAAMPLEVASATGIDTEYYPVVSDDLKTELGAYLGLPLMYDGLGLFYNTKLLRDAGVGAPPQDWTSLMRAENGVVKRLTVPGGDQGLQVAGLAMGTTNNVDHWQDLFALLMLQADASLALPDSTREQTESALRFFKSAVREQVWNERMPRSTEAFAQGRVAMMFGVSWRAFEIQAANPNLQFAIAPVPQLPGSKLGYGSYWIEGVAVRSSMEKQAAAWKLLQFLSEKEMLVRRHGLQSSKRLFGEPYPRKDLKQNLSRNQYLGGILDTSEQSRSWYLADRTFGGGFNDQIARAYEKYIAGEVQVEALRVEVQEILRVSQ